MGSGGESMGVMGSKAPWSEWSLECKESYLVDWEPVQPGKLLSQEECFLNDAKLCFCFICLSFTDLNLVTDFIVSMNRLISAILGHCSH